MDTIHEATGSVSYQAKTVEAGGKQVKRFADLVKKLAIPPADMSLDTSATTSDAGQETIPAMEPEPATKAGIKSPRVLKGL